MTAAIAVTSNTSSRLLEMLENNPQWPTEKKGLCTEICNTLQDFAYATVHKWLYQNSLPRTPEERQLVASKLGVDLIYWEYGVATNRMRRRLRKTKKVLSDSSIEALKKGAGIAILQKTHYSASYRGLFLKFQYPIWFGVG